MIRETDTASEDDIREINPDRIFTEWKNKKPAAQIAREMRLDLAIVMKILKKKQKSLVQKGR